MAYPNDPTAPPTLALSDDPDGINTNLVGFWPLTHVQGTVATDISTGGNDGTLSGGVTWASADLGNAASFDGVDGTEIIASTTVSQATTVSMWFNNTDSDRYLLDGDDATDRLAIYHSGGEFRVYAGTSVQLGSTNQYNDGNWHHIVAVFNGASSSFYVDNILKSSSNAGSNQLSGLTLGARYSSTGVTAGSIQNVRIFNTALTADQVSLLYNRPWAGTNYSDVFPYQPTAPPTLALKSGESINTGLVGWWALTDGTGATAADISTGGNDATAIGTLSHVSTARGNAMDFDGATNGLEVAYDASQQPSVITVSCWFKADDLSTDMKLASKTESGGWQFGFNSPGDTGNLSFLVRVGGAYYYASKATTGLSTGQWYHAVGTYDGSNVKLYIDNVLEDTTAIAGTILYANNNSLGISSEPGTGSGNDASLGFDGNIQNVRIWNTALTAQQVSDIYTTPWLGSNYEAAGNTYFFPASFGGRL